MRSLLLALALGVVSQTVSAQRTRNTAVSPSIIRTSSIVLAPSLYSVPTDATVSFELVPPAEPRAVMGATGGRIIAIVVGAAIGAGAAYAVVKSVDCSDCDGDAATYGAIGGAVVGGFIGSAVYSFRQRRAVTPPASIGRN